MVQDATSAGSLPLILLTFRADLLGQRVFVCHLEVEKAADHAWNVVAAACCSALQNTRYCLLPEQSR
jgi:hypothetical protein